MASFSYTDQRILVTGGAGFIGANLVDRLALRGHSVIVLDNLSRPGAVHNLRWLLERHPSRVEFVEGDVRDFHTVQRVTEKASIVYHLAAQVAVTTSVLDPRSDFECNALGTFNVLEAARLAGHNPIMVFASTNKVYGGMETVKIVEQQTRYAYADLPYGVPETSPLDFHSPYGCSKGAADQYVQDYARIYDLPTVVLRQSCIYGPRQMGVEEQGWVAWFLIAALYGRPITIYGDGKQVRDVLYIDDLIDLYEMVVERIDQTKGQVYNVGGGPDNTLSVWSEFGPLLAELLGQNVDVTYSDWRPGDQLVYISDIRKLQSELGWRPKVSILDGIQHLAEWIRQNPALFATLAKPTGVNDENTVHW